MVRGNRSLRLPLQPFPDTYRSTIQVTTRVPVGTTSCLALSSAFHLQASTVTDGKSCIFALLGNSKSIESSLAYVYLTVLCFYFMCCTHRHRLSAARIALNAATGGFLDPSHAAALFSLALALVDSVSGVYLPLLVDVAAGDRDDLCHRRTPQLHSYTFTLVTLLLALVCLHGPLHACVLSPTYPDRSPARHSCLALLSPFAMMSPRLRFLSCC